MRTFRVLVRQDFKPRHDTAPYLVAGAPAADGASAEVWVAGPDGCYASRGRIELAG